MATKLFLKNGNASSDAGAPAGLKHLDRSQGGGVTTSTATLISGPSSGEQFSVAWTSDPIKDAVTIAGDITLNIWGHESNLNDNTGLHVKLFKWTPGGGEEGTPFFDSEFGTELGTSSAVQNWVATPTSTAFAVGDRIIARVYANDAGGTMTTGTATVSYAGATPAANGDSYISFTEDIGFIRTRTIKTTGGDYTTLVAWDTGEQALLPTLNEIRQAECYSLADTSSPAIDGWDTDATHYVRIYAPASDRHDGKWNTAKYRLENGAQMSLDFVEDYGRIEGIQIKNTRTTDTGIRGILARPTQGELRINHCIVRAVHTGTASGRAIQAFNGQTVLCYNTIAYDWINAAASAGFECNSTAARFYNCTAQNCASGFNRVNGTGVLKNCLAQNCTDGYTGTWDAASTNNCSDISSDAPGSNPVTGTVSFVDAANDDFHLATSDTVAKDAGVDLSADANLAFSDDIDSTTRSGSWDIGADEVVSSPGAISGSTTLTFTPSGQIQGAGDLAGSTSLTFTPTAAIQGLVDLVGSSSLTFSVTGGITGLGTLTGASTLTFAATGVIVGSGTLSGTSTLIFSPTGSVIGVGVMAGSTTLTFSPTGAVVGFGGLAGSTTLIFAVTGLLEDGGFPGSISGSAVLSFAATGTLSAFGALSGSTTLSFTASGTPTIEEIEEPEPPAPQPPQAAVCGSVEFDESVETFGSVEFDEDMQPAEKLEFDENIGQCLPK